EIDRIRGGDTSYFIRGRLEKQLACISGRSELPGRPMLYTTTPEFLEIFGLKSLSDMPPLQELERMIPKSESDHPDDENPQVKKMRKLVSDMNSDTTRIDSDPKEDERILNEYRQRIKSIPTSTPFIEEQKLAEQQNGPDEKPALQSPDATPPSHRRPPH